MSYQPPQQQVVYQQVARPPGNGLAVASLVLGIVAIVIGAWSPIPFFGIFPAFVSFLPAVLAVVFGHIGIASSRTTGVGRGQAISGMILGYVTLGIALLVTIIWFVTLSSGSLFSSLYSHL